MRFGSRRALGAVPVALLTALTLGTAASATAATTTTTTAPAGTTVYDFEDGTTQGWGPASNTVLTNDATVAHTGTRSLAVHSVVLGSVAQVVVPGSGLTPGQGYRLQGYARTAAGQPAARVRVDAYADSTSIGIRRTGVPGDDWNLGGMLLTGFTWPSGATSLRLAVTVVQACSAGALPGVLYLDDLTLAPGAPSIGLPDQICPATTTSTTTTSTTTTSTTTTSTTSTTTTTTAAPYCRVVYTVSSQWQQGFVANIAVTNLSSSAWTNWMLTWRFSGDQHIMSIWNGSVTQSGQLVTWRPGPWQPPVQPGETVTIGFLGSGSGSNPPPTDFRANGIPCT